MAYWKESAAAFLHLAQQTSSYIIALVTSYILIWKEQITKILSQLQVDLKWSCVYYKVWWALSIIL